MLRILATALVAPVMGLSFPLVFLAVRQTARIDRRSQLRSHVGAASPARADLELTATTDTAWSLGGAGTAHRTENGDAAAGFWCLRADPEFASASYAHAFATLQRFRGPGVFDLVAVRSLNVDFFEALAMAWSADTVPRMAIVLSFERWVMSHASAIVALRPVTARGTEIAVCYMEQVTGGQIASWVAPGGELAHNAPAVIANLVRHWRPSSTWPMVINTLAELVRSDRGGLDAAELLSELAGLALSCGGSEIAAPLAREALSLMPDTPSAARSKALRRLGSALLGLNQAVAAVEALDAAITVAVACEMPILGAVPLYQSGLIALDRNDNSGAERRFRAALALLAEHPGRRLLPLVHRGLAIALMRQGHTEAEHHARTALSLHADLDPKQAEYDQRLVAQLAGTYSLNIN